MKKMIDTVEMKTIQLDMLKKFDEYCRKNGIVYYLAYGTLIGAIRHKGYIPWDDDIDLMIPRKDYDKLLKLYNKNRTNAELKVVDCTTEKGYYLPYAKLINQKTVLKENVQSDYELGVNIDLFPVDDLSDNYEEAIAIIKKCYWYNLKLQIKTITWSDNRSIIKNIVLMLGKLALSTQSISKILKSYDRFCRKNKSGKDTKYVGVLTGLNTTSKGNVFERKWFNETLRCEFEGCDFPAPVGYDKLLRNFYGDYMQLPPKDKQVTHHSFEAWYK